MAWTSEFPVRLHCIAYSHLVRHGDMAMPRCDAMPRSHEAWWSNDGNPMAALISSDIIWYHSWRNLDLFGFIWRCSSFVKECLASYISYTSYISYLSYLSNLSYLSYLSYVVRYASLHVEFVTSLSWAVLGLASEKITELSKSFQWPQASYPHGTHTVATIITMTFQWLPC